MIITRTQPNLIYLLKINLNSPLTQVYIHHHISTNPHPEIVQDNFTNQSLLKFKNISLKLPYIKNVFMHMQHAHKLSHRRETGGFSQYSLPPLPTTAINHHHHHPRMATDHRFIESEEYQYIMQLHVFKLVAVRGVMVALGTCKWGF